MTDSESTPTGQTPPLESAASQRPDDSADSTAAGPDAAALTAGLMQEAQWLQRQIQGLAHDHLSLAALETRQAGESLVRIIVLAMVSAALVVSAWLGLLAAMVVVLVQQSLLGPFFALLLAALLNGLLVWLMVPLIRSQSRNLMLSASLTACRMMQKP